jgi:phage tail sheath protein FI
MAVYQSPGVYVKELPSGSKPIEGVGTAIAAFVGFTEKGPSGVATRISNWGDYTRTFGGFVGGYATPLAIYGYFDNGGGAAYVVRVNADSGAPAPVALLPAGSDASIKSLRAKAIDPAAQVSVDVSPASEPSDETFKLTVRGPDSAVEEYDNVTLKKGKGNVLTEVKTRSKLIVLEEVATEGSLVERRPADGTYQLQQAEASPTSVDTGNFTGDVAARTGVAGLEAIDEVTMLIAPDVMPLQAMGALSMDQAVAIQLALVSHAERMENRVAILDSPPGLNAQDVFNWRRDSLKADSSYATLYYPWVKVLDPGSRQPVFMPPSGYMAGIWGRNDDARGVHKAPANEPVRGALDVQLQLTTEEQALLNPAGVNCIRVFPRGGVRVWGARTLAQIDPEFKYLNIRRLFNFIKSSILLGTQWAVFEPNDPVLWSKLRRNTSAFLTRVWRDGALFGNSPDEAFYVKCDAETNPPEVVEAGQVVVEIGLAPVRPAEFVIFNIRQIVPGEGAGGGAA